MPILSHAVEEFLEVEGVSMEEKRKILWDYCARCTVLPLVEGLFALGNEDLGDKAVLNSDKGFAIRYDCVVRPDVPEISQGKGAIWPIPRSMK